MQLRSSIAVRLYPRVLETSRAGLHLRQLAPSDAADYYALVQANAGHLTRHGDYQDEVAATADEVTESLAGQDGAQFRFGVFLHGRLIGRADLIPVDPPRFGLGYWLSEDATGNGYAGAAVGALLDHARAVHGATDVFAGVTHGNRPSEALLHRLGFTVVADLGTYNRFHLALGQVTVR
ncbi:N-acetyltransferase GCN5 [Actinoplanes friuliensis DSM 7358]|uniref:N-acetyltransferase GCN5 n=1 Tax=Actinoplanes friuliensis DSM 7358 TaxID=1246995 RepID=U5VZL2_9ACTN|nr:N-acetyltransferase GCN5 [Actinoplanes friuliensis DSM 7358]